VEPRKQLLLSLFAEASWLFSPPTFSLTMNSQDIQEIIALSLLRAAALLSLLCAAGTAAETWADHRHDRGTVVSRSQFALQLPTMAFDICYLVGQNAGRACAVQGFVIQLSVLSYLPLDMWITTTYILIICYSWNEQRLRKIEGLMHGVLWPFALIFTVIPLVYDMYNPSWEVCWIEASPPNCMDDPDIDCKRGHDAFLVYYMVYIASLVSLAYAIFAMVAIYIHVLKIEGQQQQYAFEEQASFSNLSLEQQQQRQAPAPPRRSQQQQRRRRSSRFWPPQARTRATGIQGMCYAGSTAAAGLPLVCASIHRLLTHSRSLWFEAFGNIMLLLLGVSNMLVNFRTRPYLQTRYGRWLGRMVNACRPSSCLWPSTLKPRSSSVCTVQRRQFDSAQLSLPPEVLKEIEEEDEKEEPEEESEGRIEMEVREAR